jgi:hypothetical protein
MSALRRLKQKDHEFEPGLHRETLFQKERQKERKEGRKERRKEQRKNERKKERKKERKRKALRQKSCRNQSELLVPKGKSSQAGKT